MKPPPIPPYLTADDIIHLRAWFNDYREEAWRAIFAEPCDPWTAFVIGSIHGSQVDAQEAGLPFDAAALALRLRAFITPVAPV